MIARPRLVDAPTGAGAGQLSPYLASGLLAALSWNLYSHVALKHLGR